jgi:diadenosine tetraphosphate (Ap4A) HIT family hydrolase
MFVKVGTWFYCVTRGGGRGRKSYSSILWTIDDFASPLIKDYKYWVLILRSNQGYLGHLIVSCKRGEITDLADTSKEEQTATKFSHLTPASKRSSF